MKLRSLALALASWACIGAAVAQPLTPANQAVADAEDAAALLRAALGQLADAVAAADQVLALTEVIR